MSWDLLLSKTKNLDPFTTVEEATRILRDHWPVGEIGSGIRSLVGEGYSIEWDLQTTSPERQSKLIQEQEREMKAIMERGEIPGMDFYEKYNQLRVSQETPSSKVYSIGMSVRGSGAPLEDIVSFCHRHQLQIYDPQADEEINLDDCSTNSFDEWREFRDDVTGNDPNG